MKKLLTLLLALAMVFCLASCQYLPEDLQSTIGGVIDNVTGMLGGEPTCEHVWVDATCTAPKTCSVCGTTEGEANGHTEETVAGTDATCTESGMTDGKKCSVCGETTVEQTVIAALGHTEETVAGTDATCAEAGKTDGKKCTVCGVTTVEQIAIDALGHKAGKDDGDVTTPVKCANEGCDEILVAAKEAISLTIPAFENGAVVADKINYAIGDTVKLTINPEWGYTQKLYVDGEPLMLDWNNNVYSFVAEKDSYVISGTFEQSIALEAKDPTRWETGNQAHGILTTYYPANGDSWWMYINGNYSAITIKAKNLLPVEESMDGNGQDGYQQLLSMTINGKMYAFRIYNDKGTYAVSCSAISGSVSGWGNWHAIDAEAAAAMNGDGVDFKLERVGNNLVVSVNDKVYITYAMDGVTEEDKVTSVGMQNNRNVGKYVDIPFALTGACEHTWVDATCTAPKTCSTCNLTVGETIDHAYENYVSDGNATCTEDGTKTGTCVCGAKDTVADEGSALGHTNETVAGKDATCTETGLTEGKKCSVCGVTTVNQNEIPANGHKDDDNNYKCDVCDANLCNDHNEETVAGKDATCTETGLTDGKQCSICGSIILAQEVIPANGHTAAADDGNCATAVVCANGCGYIFVEALNHDPEADDGDVTTAVKCANAGCEHIVVPAKEAITLTIPTFENGAVTADKKNYAVGDTIVLTVSAAKDYAQKLYINGETLLVDTNSKYSFVAEEGKTYEITGEFVYVKGNWFWTAEYGMLNQAHGYIHAPAVSEKNGELVPTKDKYIGGKVLLIDPSNGTKADYGVTLKMTFSNGESTSIRLVAKDSSGHYFIQAMGGILGPQWKWYYDLSEEENAAIRNGEGVWFGLALEGNTLKVTVNGVVRNRADITPTVAEGVTIEQFKVQTYNFGYAVDLKCEFIMLVETPVEPETPVDPQPPVDDGTVALTIGNFANGTVTADQDSYKVGDTVTLTVAPAAGHFQKLYINGEPMMLGWKTFTYSFVATEKAYEITGSFETGLSLKPGDWGRWDDHNQLHGVLNTYYPSNGDSWWMDINGAYQSVEITAKNLVPKADSMDGNGQNGYMQIIRFGLSNGKTYAFRIYNDKGTYAVSCTAVSNSSSGWGNWKNVEGVLGYSIDDAMAGDGVQFKVERTSANTMTISVNGVKMFDYTMDGVTEADTVTFVGIQSNANSGKYVEIPFELK